MRQSRHHARISCGHAVALWEQEDINQSEMSRHVLCGKLTRHDHLRFDTKFLRQPLQLREETRIRCLHTADQ